MAETVAASLDFVRPLAPALASVAPAELVEEALERARARDPDLQGLRRLPEFAELFD